MSATPTTTRRTLWIAGASIAVVLLAILAYLFQPWRAFTTTVVDEDLPPVAIASTAEPSTEPSASAAEATTAAEAGPTPSPTTPSPTPSPTTPSPEPTYTTLAEGSFITHEHATTGAASLVEQPDGSVVLAIAALETSDGPDLHVWLTDQPVIEGTAGWHVFDDGEYVELGALKGNVGDQVYEIPEGVDVSKFQSVSIWCARFAVSFGAAELLAA
ncbi:DM13 domain-containing protein [Serinibacter salmoneus]|uniref:Electron transfer DM13 n=1 Tax=Serinibacter salmoneus TaxID=556530 RepID=A0A2A9CZ70_9MICO|nr:DM13 domain-containing protein [Serinibacter salmoneus]PFG19416.1 electron transfer DM13 [Serinibacter salmoneus]